MTNHQLPITNYQSLLNAVRELSVSRRAPAILVGGAVRDMLLGVPLADFDFAVQGNAVALARAVANTLGGDFYVMDDERGTARVILKDEGRRMKDESSFILHPSAFILDFASCRGATWQEDLFARDFSVNAIGLDLQTGELLDPTGGQSDLERRVIRQTRPGAIDDDPVRALRAVRMSLSLSATIEPDTATAIRLAALHLDQPSPERVRDELMKILSRPDAARGVRLLDSFGLLAPIAPEIEPMRACDQSPPHRFNVLEHTFVVLDYADELVGPAAGWPATPSSPIGPAGSWPYMAISDQHRAELAAHLARPISGGRTAVAAFRFALLLHDSGKPRTRTLDERGSTHFANHPAVGADLAARRARELRLSSDEVQRVRTIIQHHMRPNLMARAGDTSLRAQYRLWRDVGDCLPELALLCVADGMGKAGEQTKVEDRQRRAGIAALLLGTYYTRFAPAVAPAPLIHGEDVLALGIAPGPRIGQIIESAREAQIVGDIHTRDDALDFIRQLAAGNDA